MTQSLGDAAGLGASAYSSDDVLCMMYGVDVDKEDAEHKVAFFSVDGAVKPRPTAVAAAAAPRPTSPPDASRLPLRRHPGRATPTRRREEESPRFSETSGERRRRRVWKNRRRDRRRGVRGGLDVRRAASIADRIHSEHGFSSAVYPEASRYAKQLRYDGYKIVLVTSQPERVARRAPGEIDGRVESHRLATRGGRCRRNVHRRDPRGRRPRRPGRRRARAQGAGVRRRGWRGPRQVHRVRQSGSADLPLMRVCGKAYAVSPDAAVAVAASENGWQTLGWAEDAERKAARAGELAAEARDGVGES